MEGWLPIFYFMVILKIPVAALLYLVWWAWRSETQPEEAPGDDGHRFGRFRREPKGPRGPRRGPHAPDSVPLPACPPGGRSRVPLRPRVAHAVRAHGHRRGSSPSER